MSEEERSARRAVGRLVRGCQERDSHLDDAAALSLLYSSMGLALRSMGTINFEIRATRGQDARCMQNAPRKM